MPRHTSCTVHTPGRSIRGTRETSHNTAPRGFTSWFRGSDSYNYNDMMRRLASLFEYGHRAERTQKPPQTETNKPDPQDSDVLGVESIDFNIPRNTEAHHTDEYDITDASLTTEPKLVVRRGQPFDLSVTFNRPYDKTKDELKLVLQAGKRPIPSKGTHVEIVLSDKDEPKKWGAKIKNQSGNVLTITVFTPPTCYVAKWDFKLDVLKKKDEKKVIFRYNHKDQIYVLFNPWCRDDAVYMENQEMRDEYVLNDTGAIYAGTHSKISAKPWVFGQFKGKVLDCCMYLLEEANMTWGVRGNPIPIVRRLTAMVNSQDEYGVLTGNWSGDYSGGTSPLSWLGSSKILEQYYETKQPVKFGQCWVFSGLVTTVLRALGMPARSVTNFASAHDTDGSITIDIHFDENGEAEDSLNEDSVWNFHVWNEAWMSRPDLPKGYGGWQACDATPQEASDGIYCCGPVPVLAIKQGEVNLPYDGQFIFAEVNADQIYWTVHPDGSCDKVYIQKNSVGRNISTKAVKLSQREDVTNRYKYAEGCAEERVAVLKANQIGSCREDISEVYDMGEQDVAFELFMDKDTFVGSDFELVLKMTNNSKENRTIKGCLSSRSMYYTGVPAKKIAVDKLNVVLEPGKCSEYKLLVKASEYQDKLEDMCMLLLTAMARAVETKQVFTDRQTLRLRKPHLDIKAPKEGKVGEPVSLDISFTNPLDQSLTKCKLQIDGPGLEPITVANQNIGTKQTFVTTASFTPVKAGEKVLVIIFESKELQDINGTCTIKIRK